MMRSKIPRNQWPSCDSAQCTGVLRPSQREAGLRHCEPCRKKGVLAHWRGIPIRGRFVAENADLIVGPERDSWRLRCAHEGCQTTFIHKYTRENPRFCRLHARPNYRVEYLKTWKVLKDGARKRKVEFLLDYSQVVALLKDKCCVYCEQPHGALPFGGSLAKNLHGGLDRVDPTRPYVVENVVPCCRACNVRKNVVLSAANMFPNGRKPDRWPADSFDFSPAHLVARQALIERRLGTLRAKWREKKS